MAPKILGKLIIHRTYTCGAFDENRAVDLVREFFQLAEYQAAIF